MDTKQIKQKILDLAIRGKLVPQNPADEPASVLLERIKAEKAQLIKEGKIKKEKPLAPIEEVPFEIPESWEWCLIGEILNLQAGKNISASDIHEKNEEFTYPCFGGNGIRGYVREYNRDGVFPIIGRQGALCGNINVAKGKFYATEHAVVTESFANTSIELITYFLKTLNLNKYATATAQPGLAVATINTVNIPLPPLEEQKRIVAEIDRWFKWIDELEQNQQDLHTAIKQAKSKILDLAIHGKLVPQDANDKPASVLLDRIKAEKAQLIKEGKVKKEKPLAPIEEVLFEIPESWEWCKIRDISSQILYGVSESAKSSGSYKLLRITDIQDNKVNWETVPYTDFDKKKVCDYLLSTGDILFARTGATVGKSYLVVDTPYPAIYASYLIRVKSSSILLPNYVKYFFESGYYWEQISDNSIGTGQPNVNGTVLSSINIPMPPQEEQKRIVTKIEELFSQLDKIEDSLN